jgi:DNA polymerase III sliding clamp (beta) subunit (PCNA family)
MKFKVERSGNLAQALSRVSKAPDDTQRGGHSALVRLRAQRNRVELLARDEIVAATTSTDANVEAEGACAVSIKLLNAVLSSAPEGLLEVSRTEEDVVFIAPNWRRCLRAASADVIHDFPRIPARNVSLPARQLLSLLERTGHAASSDLGRPDRASVVVQRTEGQLLAHATDGHRAARAVLAVAPAEASPTPMIIHQHAIRELQQILGSAHSANVGVSFSRSHMFLVVPGTSIAILQPSVVPADTTQVFGHEVRTWCSVPVSSLTRALDSGFETVGTVEVALTLESDRLVLYTEEGARGSALDEIATVRHGPRAEIRVNSRYLRDAVKVIGDDSDVAFLGMNGPMDPLVVRPSAADETEAVVMAMCRTT